MRPIPYSRNALAAKAVLAGILVFAVAGCGFHPAGSVGHLPAVMHQTCIQSEEPYGHLENFLRNALRERGEQVGSGCGDKDAVLDIMDHSVESRVLAVNSKGQPQQYQLIYHVQFRLLGASGKELLAPTDIQLQRQLAYSVYNELGVGQRKQSLVQDMQREASRLILLRLEALDRKGPPGPAPATNQTNV